VGAWASGPHPHDDAAAAARRVLLRPALLVPPAKRLARHDDAHADVWHLVAPHKDLHADKTARVSADKTAHVSGQDSPRERLGARMKPTPLH